MCIAAHQSLDGHLGPLDHIAKTQRLRTNKLRELSARKRENFIAEGAVTGVFRGSYVYRCAPITRWPPWPA